jgi:hypothetical protein
MASLVAANAAAAARAFAAACDALVTIFEAALAAVRAWYINSGVK